VRFGRDSVDSNLIMLNTETYHITVVECNTDDVLNVKCHVCDHVLETTTCFVRVCSDQVVHVGCMYKFTQLHSKHMIAPISIPHHCLAHCVRLEDGIRKWKRVEKQRQHSIESQCRTARETVEGMCQTIRSLETKIANGNQQHEDTLSKIHQHVHTTDTSSRCHDEYLQAQKALQEALLLHSHACTGISLVEQETDRLLGELAQARAKQSMHNNELEHISNVQREWTKMCQAAKGRQRDLLMCLENLRAELLFWQSRAHRKNRQPVTVRLTTTVSGCAVCGYEHTDHTVVGYSFCGACFSLYLGVQLTQPTTHNRRVAVCIHTKLGLPAKELPTLCVMLRRWHPVERNELLRFIETYHHQ